MEINIQNVSMTYPSGKQALQNLSSQAVKGEAVGPQGFQLGCTNFPPFIENSRSHCGAMAPGILQIVVK